MFSITRWQLVHATSRLAWALPPQKRRSPSPGRARAHEATETNSRRAATTTSAERLRLTSHPLPALGVDERTRNVLRRLDGHGHGKMRTKRPDVTDRKPSSPWVTKLPAGPLG